MPLVRKGPATPEALPPLDWRAELEILRNGTAEARWAAARALGAAPEAAAALGQALYAEADPRLREAIFSSLARQNCAASFDAALAHLRGEDAGLRSGALEALRLMPDVLRARLPALLRDADADIRVLACDLARQLPVAEACALLTDILDRETEANVCAAAIDVLAETGGMAELDALAACAARFPVEFFLKFSVKTASERIRLRAGA